MTTPVLSYRPKTGDGDVVVDLDRLVASRMLIQANSGGGKSRAIRQLLEQTHGRVQHLVLDPEGEFATLRERFDYVLAGKEGDVHATPKTAKLLCRRLVELGASAVLDLYDLNIHERREFVRLFLLELMNLPRTLWRPILVVIDEAHLFAPQSGESQSLEAVTLLCTQGRKRGFAAILATQRISKLHKDAAAELLNKLIGRTGLDVDQKRAGDELGLNQDGRRELARLKPGEFYAYGPAISPEIQLVRTGDVVTTHPEAGTLGSAPPPAPTKVRAMLAQLQDLPKEAEEEARTVADLQRQLRDAQAKLRKAEKSGGGERVVEKVVVDERAISRAIAAAVKPLEHRAERTRQQIERTITGLRAHVAVLEPLAVSLGEDIAGAVLGGRVPIAKALETMAVSAPRPRTSAPRVDNAVALNRGERAILTAIAQHEDGVDREQLSVLTGYKRSSRDTYLQRLHAAGLIGIAGDAIGATAAGLDALGADFTPLPTGEALQRYWLDRLSGGEQIILDLLCAAYPRAVPRDEISEETQYKRSSRDTYLQRLAARKLVVTDREGVRASALLFDGGSR